MKILWIPHTGWHTPQRAHLFCRALAQKHEVHVTDWVADFSGPKDIISAKYLRNFYYRRYLDQNIKVHGIPRISPALFFPTLRKFNQKIYALYVDKIIRAYQIDVVIGSFVVPPPNVKRLIFDAFDDNVSYWRDLRNNRNYAQEIYETEKMYVGNSDYIVTVSSVLKEKIEKQIGLKNINTFVIPNGVDIHRYENLSGKAIKQRLGISQKKVIGFISSMGEFCGLIKLINAFSKISNDNLILLVIGDGPLLKPAQKLVVDQRLSNVVFTGTVPFSDIPQYYKSLDVGIIPFDKMPFTDSACPIKLFEYSAASVNVVSTELEEIRRINFPNVILVKDDSTSLASGIVSALEKPFVQPKKLGEYDRSHLVYLYERVITSF